MDLLEKSLESCPKEAVLMGMDLGSKTIGIAISDSAQNIAFPLTTVIRKKFTTDLQQIEAIAREYNVAGYILGYPLNMDGSEGPRCQSVRDFGLEFKAQICDDWNNDDLWVALWDERLSTVSVESFVGETVDISKKRAKERGILDKLAAQHILQGALDYIQKNRV